MRTRQLFVVWCLLVPAVHALQAWGNEQGRFMVTGHILNKREEVGVVEGFLAYGVPFINRSSPDFLVLTGDVVLGGTHGAHRFPVETINKQYAFLRREVLAKIHPRVYCVAGNHDTGHEPHQPSIELFENLLNPLHFSFEHKGSLFVFLSLYQPFPHVPIAKDIPPFRTIWHSYETPACRTFLDTLRGELHGDYDHIFIFIHVSPLSDIPLGYFWSRFVVPLLSSLSQDVHVFSTDHFTRDYENRDVRHVVRWHNIRFYPFAVFPRGIYTVDFDRQAVRVALASGERGRPVTLQEIAYRPASRLSMLRRYLTRRIWDPLRWWYRYGIYYLGQMIHKLRALIGE